jgi:chromosome segregation ATPase
MAKATKVQTYDDRCDEEHDNKSESDDDDEPTKDELIGIKKREYKDLHKELKALKQAFDELNATHESLKEDHKELGKAHKKLEKLIPLYLMSKMRRSML